MRFILLLGAVCLSLQAGQAAATIASYSATGYGAFGLVSARSTLTGEDVSGYLAPSLYDDNVSYRAGSADPNRYYTPSVPLGLVTGGHGGAVSGTAETPGGSAASYFATYLVYEFAYLDALYCEYENPGSPYCPSGDLGAFDLTFDYYLETSALISLLGSPGSVDAFASASLEMSLCGETFTVSSSAFASPSDFDTLSGTCSILVERGNSTFVDITVLPVEGAAAVAEVIPTPLPAALPLLAAGLGGLGLLGRRRALKASSS